MPPGKTLKGFEHARKQDMAGLLKDACLVHDSFPTERGECAQVEGLIHVPWLGEDDAIEDIDLERSEARLTTTPSSTSTRSSSPRRFAVEFGGQGLAKLDFHTCWLMARRGSTGAPCPRQPEWQPTHTTQRCGWLRKHKHTSGRR